MVRFIFQNTMHTDSWIGQNIRYLEYKCGFYVKDLVKLTCTDIISIVCDEWKDRMTDDNVRVAEQVKELVYVRDGMDEWLLEKGKINDIINYLWTYWLMYTNKY